MRIRRNADIDVQWMRSIRRAIEYGIAVAAALLCSYWIVQGHG